MDEHTDRTQDRATASKGLQGVREAAQRDKGLRFTTLLHHVNEKLLLDSFYLLKRQAAPGVDRVTWSEYEEGVEGRIADLQRPDSSRRVGHGRRGMGLLIPGQGRRSSSPLGQPSRHGESTSRNRTGGNGLTLGRFLRPCHTKPRSASAPAGPWGQAFSLPVAPAFVPMEARAEASVSNTDRASRAGQSNGRTAAPRPCRIRFRRHSDAAREPSGRPRTCPLPRNPAPPHLPAR